MKRTLLVLSGFFYAFSACSGNQPGREEGKIPDAKQEPVRAVWIPDPSHTSCMTTYQNVLNTINLLDEIGINTIYLCAWARTQTIFKSEVLTEYSTYETPEEGCLFAGYIPSYNFPKESPTGDPLKDLIVEAGKRNIAVIFWFEYGFMASRGSTPASNPLLASHPEWMSKNKEGVQAHYNNTDYYWNAYHPEVQEFMLKLIEESMTLYPEIAGIQTDDRMPAMPRNSGYDNYTIGKYKKEHNNIAPPNDINNAGWVQWRLTILNQFAKDLYDRVKAKNPTAKVCFSPNPYPWCEENLMQAWPQWLKAEIVDILSVQCYRNTIESYALTIQTTNDYIKENTRKFVFNPGIILKNGETFMSKELLEQQLNANKAINTNGESFFYIDGFYNPESREVVRQFYKAK
jgi:uncharacterized lipoprotein YddW (UPF0748 family)